MSTADDAARIARVLSRMEALAGALEFAAEQLRAEMGPVSGTDRGYYYAGQAVSFDVAAANVRQALAGDAPELITPEGARAYEGDDPGAFRARFEAGVDHA